MLIDSQKPVCDIYKFQNTDGFLWHKLVSVKTEGRNQNVNIKRMEKLNFFK